MERIDFHGSFFPVPAKPSENKKTPQKKSSAARSFPGLLQLRAEEQEPEISAQEAGRSGEAALSEALDAVHISGDKLKKSPTLQTVDDYKKAVRRFLKIVVAACYDVEKTLTRRAHDNRENVQIRIIDEKLERLAARIMHSQREETEILRRVDEIYGLLVDLRQ
ncbi:MAG: YaaR family protein [Spirochaetales bacterium]|jgi:uncharacterized protein YaaR (DUF327 family)|nr:YaaR family protein [Spirochaetales bacterium]